ncbi:MAG: selenium metabolism-associated LysR family transcriptional regulator [Candidatus Methylomirabilales bacterium]
MNLPHLRTFLAVAQDRSFSRAAEKLFITQPAVSKQIQALEEMLGLRLFDRVGRSVILTEVGHILQNHAHIAFQSLEEARETISQLRGLQRGHLRVSAASTIGTYMLPKPLGAFKAKHPGIEISLAITNKARVVQQLLNHEVELGFVGPPVEPGELEKEEYLLDELVLIVAPTHRLAHEEAVAVRDLTEEVFILREQGSGTREIMEEELGRVRVSLKKAMELGSTEAVKQAVAENLGVSIVSKFAITLEILQGRLTAVRLPELNLRRQLFITYHKGRTLSAAAQEFCQLLKQTSGGERKPLSPKDAKIRSRRGRSASVSSKMSS